MTTVRVSLANLVYGVVVDGSIFKGAFGIISPNSFASGKMRVQALGGGAELTNYGIEFLRLTYGAHEFEVDQGTGNTDARFLVEQNHVDAIFSMFEDPSPTILEVDPTREIFDELLKPYPFGSVLTSEDLVASGVQFVDQVRQPVPEAGIGTSLREKAGLPTKRMFRRFNLHLRHEAFLKLRESPAVVFLSSDELATTNGGRRKGVTRSGLEMADNLFP